MHEGLNYDRRLRDAIAGNFLTGAHPTVELTENTTPEGEVSNAMFFLMQAAPPLYEPSLNAGAL